LSCDLDCIVRMAARKEPEQRYGSVADLSEDLRRYLEGHPVRARPGTALYRALKLVRRNRATVAAGVMILVSIVAEVTATFRQARRAERRFQEVRQMANTFLFDFEKAIHDLPGTTEARKLVITQGLTYLERLADEARGNRQLSREVSRGYRRMAAL